MEGAPLTVTLHVVPDEPAARAAAEEQLRDAARLVGDDVDLGAGEVLVIRHVRSPGRPVDPAAVEWVIVAHAADATVPLCVVVDPAGPTAVDRVGPATSGPDPDAAAAITALAVAAGARAVDSARLVSLGPFLVAYEPSPPNPSFAGLTAVFDRGLGRVVWAATIERGGGRRLELPAR